MWMLIFFHLKDKVDLLAGLNVSFLVDNHLQKRKSVMSNIKLRKRKMEYFANSGRKQRPNFLPGSLCLLHSMYGHV